MAEQNVEIVRRYLEEVKVEQDTAARMAQFWEPDGDFYPVRRFPEARPCHGRDEIASFLGDWLSVWERFSYSLKDVKAVSDDRVFAHGRIRAEGRASGMSLEGDIYHCCWLRHGRFIRIEDHLTASGAIRALGLSGDALEAADLSD
jgi:hypothetical protein